MYRPVSQRHTLLVGMALKSRYSVRRLSLALFGAFLLALALCLLLSVEARAFTVQGGTAEQRALVSSVIEACAVPAAETEAELQAFGPVQIRITPMTGVSGYSEIGKIYINAAIAPGPALSELAAHEWAHQIWYSLGPKWWQKWAALCDPSQLSEAGAWRKDVAENFAECAKVSLWSSVQFLRDYPVTDLESVPPEEVVEWVFTARYAKKCPFSDLRPSAMDTTQAEDELAAAAGYVHTRGMMTGYPDGSFRSFAFLTKHQLAAVCERAHLPHPRWWSGSGEIATREEVRDAVPGLAWTGGSWSDPITRGQMARLVWRVRD